jgi:hypothetical protein
MAAQTEGQTFNYLHTLHTSIALTNTVGDAAARAYVSDAD